MCLGGGAGLEGVTPREGDLLLNLQQNRDEQGLCFPGDCGPSIPVPWEKLHIPLKPWKALPGCNEQTSCFDAHGGKLEPAEGRGSSIDGPGHLGAPICATSRAPGKRKMCSRQQGHKREAEPGDQKPLQRALLAAPGSAFPLSVLAAALFLLPPGCSPFLSLV